MRKQNDERPGVKRLRAMNAGPRQKRNVNVTQAIIATPKAPAARKHKPAEGQAALF